jgi:hypothetical protein
MLEDEGIRSSPRKHSRPVSAADAAKNIVKNKETKKSKNSHSKKHSAKDKTEVGKNDNDPKKSNPTNALGITNESEESDADNFEPDAEKKA